jgi:hypothetical protein
MHLQYSDHLLTPALLAHCFYRVTVFSDISVVVLVQLKQFVSYLFMFLFLQQSKFSTRLD